MVMDRPRYPWVSEARGGEAQRSQGPCPGSQSISRGNSARILGGIPMPLAPHLVRTHPEGSGLGFSSRDSSLSAPVSSSSELELAATASSFLLGFLLRSLFFRPVEDTPSARASGSLAVLSWESEGNPDRSPPGMGDVHRRGGTCSCGTDQGL